MKMSPLIKYANDSVHMFMNELSSRVVAHSGIPSDRYHLGKLILHSLLEGPEFVVQINGIDNEVETSVSVLTRTVQCAIGLKKLGLATGDAIVLMGPNHIDLAIPLYAALYLGIMVAAIDVNLGVDELKETFLINEPKIVFCQSVKAADVQTALHKADLDAEIVTFDKESEYCSFAELLQKYKDEEDISNFKPVDFDPETTVALLVATSGSTGLPKSAALTHKNMSISVPYTWLGHSEFPTPTIMVLVVSPLQWLSAGLHFLFSPILRYTRLQSPRPMSQEDFIHLVDKYHPTYIAISPNLMTTVLKPGKYDRIDLTSFETILLGGSAVPEELMDEIKEMSPETRVACRYGLSEIGGFGFHDDFPHRGSVGKPIGCLDYLLVNSDTKEPINEPHVKGELWLRGPIVCKGYYKNPEATAEAFEDDGWFRTGDMFYRDEQWNFFFVERLKFLLKYMNHQISPVEIEAVIRRHPGVLDAAVTGVPRRECGDVPVACVVPRAHCTPTAQEIKDLVKNSLADSKQLRGGVIFMKELPMTSTTKVHRRKLREIVLAMDRE